MNLLEIADSKEGIEKYVSGKVEIHLEKAVPMQKQGEAYYRTLNPDIMNKKKEYWSSKGAKPMVDPYHANNQIANSYAKLLVDQKIGYSVNERLSVSADKKVADSLDDVLSLKHFRKYLRKVAKEASNKIYGALQFYLEGAELDYNFVPAEQVIPIYDVDDMDDLEAVIKVYTEDKTYKAELWTDDAVVYLEKLEASNGFKVVGEPVSNMTRTVSALGQELETQNVGWGRPPFAILLNNDERQRDIDPILSLLKVWDIVVSDFANNLEDFQDVFWILQNYGGQDVEEFLDEVKRLKVLKVGEGGSAETKQAEIPTEAREKMLTLLERSIYRFGRGVSPEDFKGTNVTNVMIYAMYSNLELKANEFEMQLQEFFDQVLELVNVYAKEVRGLEPFKTRDVDLRFKRAMLLNKTELVESLLKQDGFLSKRTLLSLHPDIDDVEAEIKEIEKEKADTVDSMGGDMGFTKTVPQVPEEDNTDTAEE